MVAIPQIGRKLTYKRWERRLRLRSLRQAMRAVPTQQGLPEKPFYETATAEEWIAAFTEWTESHHDLPRVPVSAYSREADYEDRD